MKRLTAAELRAHNTARKRRWREQQRNGKPARPVGRPRRPWSDHTPRCPECGYEISVTLDCKCPKEQS